MADAKFSAGEAAGLIADALKVDRRDMTKLVARFKNFQRLGILPNGSGKGRAISFTSEDVVRAYRLLRLNLAGVYPTAAGEALRLSNGDMVSLKPALGFGCLEVSVSTDAIHAALAKARGQ